MTVVTGSSRIGLTGRDSDRTIAAYLIQTLTATGERLAQAHSRQVMAQYRETLKAFQNQGPSGEWRPYPMKPSNPKLSFLAGYQSAITERLAEQRKQQQAHNPNAIIRLTNALKESNDHAKSIMPNLRSARMAGGPRSQDAGSKAAGYAAGRGANLSGGIGAGGQVGARMRLGAGAS
jgi:hypothetical protein